MTEAKDMGYYELKGNKVALNDHGAFAYVHECKLKLPRKQDASATPERASNGEQEEAL